MNWIIVTSYGDAVKALENGANSIDANHCHYRGKEQSFKVLAEALAINDTTTSLRLVMLFLFSFDLLHSFGPQFHFNVLF